MKEEEGTKILPFSNATEFTAWMSRNCDLCDLYENESIFRDEAKCEKIFDIRLSQLSEYIPIETINYFGYNKNYVLADCPRLHCNRVREHTDLLKAKKKLEENKKNELPLEF